MAIEGVDLAAPTGKAGVDIVDTDKAIQYVKVMNGTDGAADVIPGDATNGLDVDVTRMAALIASEAHIGQVSGHSKQIEVAPTVDTSAYASGDLMGGKLTLTSAMRANAGTGVLQSIRLVDQDKERKPLTVVIFNVDPDGTSFTDQSALAIADADMAKVAGVVSIAAADYVSFHDNALAMKTNIGIGVQSGANTPNLFACLVTRGTPTYTAGTDLSLLFTFLQD